MALLISSRLMTRVGAIFIRNARTLANNAYRSKASSKHQIINGFLLRAIGKWSESEGASPFLERGSYIASVMDTPGYILLAGPVRIVQNGVSLLALATSVGIRDDFESPGSSSQFTFHDKQSFYVLSAPTLIRNTGYPFAIDWFPRIQQRDWFLGYSRMDIPLKNTESSTNYYSLDDENYFDFSCRVALAGSITSFPTGSRTAVLNGDAVEFGPLKLNYFLRNQYSIDEDDLPDRWKLLVRRLVPLELSAPYGDFRRPIKDVLLNGFAFIPASTSSVLEGKDIYCHAARTYRQYQTPWGITGPEDFDRNGEQGLLVAIGEQDRSDYDPEVGTNLFASTTSLRVFRPQDIQQSYLHPSPEMVPADPFLNKPSFPNFGSFLTPNPVALADGFVVFSVYTTYLDRGDADHRGDAWSLITTLPDGRNLSLRADWDVESETIPTGVDGEFMYPWIVGSASIPDENAVTACCLVWEQTYQRGAIGIPIKGEWALYTTTGGNPQRKTIPGYAPPFAVLQHAGSTSINRFDSPTYDLTQPIASAYHAGEQKMVTACIDYPPSASERTIRCAVFDVPTGTMSVGGVIATSTDSLDKCFITVVQPFQAPREGKEAVPAVLLASITRHAAGNNGGNGKVFLSVDGGGEWREYLTDAGAQGGAFYVGNKLWKFDLSAGLDGRIRR
ncbi:hypothetical protein KDX38_11050 [Pseudomonas sp. CDFA 602]|uniref:hypothetical protein n=1 Tax=Pseudomonas californiensis TaxID=2829823 RepID=UPI001E35AE00|nr:hypothetical protein [Pseudomonas californiensis]MCD5994145.1 hypothetical protein [Pseudomonas californiensis]MCD5999756.1 hypothetical protein [Pseudomonas californiensis]